jgi:hypothetical protein
MKVVETFMNFYWESERFPEVIYIQSALPTILLYAPDSTYARAMTSVDDMKSYVEGFTRVCDDAGNMDW